ncbi:hypothetical protein [Rhizobium sp. RCC_161_2]|uniref:hypothetical protein n=1 Tax=Rhizobium sp. RCC_161_2 TaxID=3239219 RepID=UPI00352494DA
MRDLGIFWATHWHHVGLENNCGLEGISNTRSHGIDMHPPFHAARASEYSPGKYLPGLTSDDEPRIPLTGRIPAFGTAIADRSKKAKCQSDVTNHKLQFVSGIAVANPGKSRRSIRPSLGFTSVKTAYSTLKGFKMTRALNTDQTTIWRYGDCAMGRNCPINGLFGIYAV